MNILLFFEPQENVETGDDDFTNEFKLRQDWAWIDIGQDENDTQNSNSSNSTDNLLNVGITGWQVIKKPLHTIEFLTGFIVGTNLTGNGKEMKVCGSTFTMQLSEAEKVKSLM